MSDGDGPRAPSRNRFLHAAAGGHTDRPPVWMMRQAGRYLPEYRDVRGEYSFKEAISTPDVAIEISLQPWERFEPDGVVMYSDILPALELLGFSFHLESGTGPVIENPITHPADIDERVARDAADELGYMGDVLGGLTTHLGDRAAVIGFVGGPFTLSAYAVEGQGSRNFMALRRLRWENPTAFATLLDRVGDVIANLAAYQVASGADVVQLFDTYAGLLSIDDFRDFVLPVQRRIIDAIDVPTIVFSRNMGGRLEAVAASGADVVSVDWTIDLADARTRVGDRAVQGNLDPAVLFAPPAVVRNETGRIIAAGGGAGHILNLGHGVHKSTPVEGVEAFFDAAKRAET